MISELKGWLHTDTLKEAYKCLEKLDETLSLIQTDNYQWKWALITLHNCAQAFMVLALEGTNQIDVVKNRELYADYLNKLSQGKEIDDKMMKKINGAELNNFLRLYSKIKDISNSQQFWTDTEFQSTEEKDEGMEKLNDYRNRFIHFLPCSWGIELSGLLNICTSVMVFIQFMISNGNFMYKFSDEEQVQIRDFTVSINNKLGAIEYGE